MSKPSIQEILKELRSLGSEENRQGMARFGIDAAQAFGVPTEPLRKMARRLGRDHRRALALWRTGNREARVVATDTADPAVMTAAEMDAWVEDMTSWDICDGCAIHLFRKSPLAWKQARKWARRKPEFVRRSGFALLAALAVHDKQAPDELFLAWLPVIEATANDERNFVKKAVNWALRQIGKRNAALCHAAMDTAQRLKRAESPSARWIGSDALRELRARKLA